MAGCGSQFSSIEAALKKGAAALRDADVPFALGGSLAVWARGGPESCNDLDFMMRREDAERALRALVAVGMKPQRPPEEWLLKAWDGDVLVDLIFEAAGVPVIDEVLERAEEMSVFSLGMRVLALEDVITSKLLALNAHELDYEPVLTIARAVRERVDWPEVAARTSGSPYARAFFGLMEALEIWVPGREGGRPANRIRVVPASP
jgi:hypothetical protein